MTATRYCPTCKEQRPLRHEHPPTLFEGDYVNYDGTPPHEAVSTSVAAAESIRPTANRLQALTLAAIQERGEYGATDDELETITGLKHQTVSARRRELYLRGLILPVGERLTRSGRRAKVWTAVPTGVQNVGITG